MWPPSYAYTFFAPIARARRERIRAFEEQLPVCEEIPRPIGVTRRSTTRERGRPDRPRAGRVTRRAHGPLRFGIVQIHLAAHPGFGPLV